MGADPTVDKELSDYETPQHRLNLDAYYIGKTPITVAQFGAFVQATGYTCNAQLDIKNKKDHPVGNVTWKDARAFCAWASQVTRQAVVLPSEAQWEKAARGPDGRLYPWGNEVPDRTRCNIENWFKGPTPVGQFSPLGDSPYGCVDMIGNVWEWTCSLYKDYPYDPGDGREDLAAGDEVPRVLRGGSFDDHRRYARCSYRFRNFPSYYYVDRGFRVGVSAPIYL